MPSWFQRMLFEMGIIKIILISTLTTTMRRMVIFHLHHYRIKHMLHLVLCCQKNMKIVGKVESPGSVAGYLSLKCANDFGLKEGIPVAVSTIDVSIYIM